MQHPNASAAADSRRDAVISSNAWSALADHAPRGLALTVGAEHRVEYTNSSFARLTSLQRRDGHRRSIVDVLRVPGLASQLDAVLRNGHSLYHIPIYSESGTEYLLSAWTRADAGEQGLVVELDTPQQDNGATIPHAGADDRVPDGEIREVNARLVRAAIREQELAEQARAGSRAKSEFLALISHELRTPLTAVIGYTDMLLTGLGGLNEQGTAWAEKVRFSAWHLRQIVDDLISTVSENPAAGAGVLEWTTANTIADEAVALIEPGARQKGLDVQVDCPDPDLRLHTDRRRVRQVLVNLLSNAVKFTDRGFVRLEVGDAGEAVLFRVRDSGIGIAEEDLERIFEPFVQVDPTTTRRHGGCGLGLGLSRRFASELGGELTVTSTPGSGSTFVLALPPAGARDSLPQE